MKLRIVFYLFLISFSIFNNFSYSEEKDITKKNTVNFSTKNDNINNGFLSKIANTIFPDEHPIFKDKKNELYISYNVSFNKGKKSIDGEGKGLFHRKVHSFQFHYAQPNKFLRANGRISAGFFTMHGVSGAYKDLYKAYGIELIQELVFGTSMFYITAGIGPSFMLGKTGKIDGTNHGLTGFNFSSVIRIGHRFDCGAIFELEYHHYSNGGLGKINEGIDLIGASIGYVF